MKKVLSLVLLLTMVFSLVACGAPASSAPAAAASGDASTPPAAVTEIVIGGIQDLSGGAATSGVAMNRGVEIAIEEINAAGGINGAQIKYICYDVKGDPQEAINAYNRLVDQDKACAIIGPPISNIGLALVDLAASKKVPVLGAYIDSRVTKKEDGKPQDYMFLNQPTNQQAGEIQAAYLLDTLGAKKVGLFYDQGNAFGVSQVAAFKDYILANGGEIVSEQTFKSGDKDFKTQLTKIKEAGAEGIFAPNYPQDNTLYVTQLKQLGMDGLYTMGGLDFAPPYLTTLPDASIVNNVYFAINIAFDDPAVAALNDKVIAKYDDIKTVDDISVKFYLGYDAATMMKAALEYADGNYTGENMKAALENMGPIEQKTGTFGFSAESHQPLGLGMVMYKIEAGKNIKIGPYVVGQK